LSLLVVVAVIFVVAGLLAALKAKQGAKEDGFGFDKKEFLFSPAERSFLGVLEQALDSQFRVFGKVRLGDLVKPAKGLTPSKRTSASNRIKQKHVDFVICSATDLTVRGVVELDDQSHAREDRAKRDDFVNQVLSAAKIPIIHFSAKKGYSLQEVRTRLAECLSNASVSVIPGSIQNHPIAEKPESVQMERPLPDVNQVATEPVITEKSIREEPPVCPKCASEMVRRQATKGQHAGKHFWACTAYPKCRQVIAIGET